MLGSLSAVVDRHAAAWVGLAVLLTLLAPGLQDVATLDDAALLPEGSASQPAAVAIEELFPADPGRNTWRW